MFDLFTKKSVEIFHNISIDPEIQDKIKYYSNKKKLELMMQLWKEDFRIDADIISKQVAVDIDKQIDAILSEIASHQTPPEGDNWVCWIGADGVMHVNKEK